MPPSLLLLPLLAALASWAESVEPQPGTGPYPAGRQDAAQEGDTRSALAAVSSRLDQLTDAIAALPTRRDLQEVLAALAEELRGSRVLGQPCRGDQDCSAISADTVCSGEGRCVCREGLQEVAGGVCRPYPHPSQPCRRYEDCRGGAEHSRCSDNVCVCESQFMNVNDTECRLPGLTEACTSSNQCYRRTTGSICKDNVCACYEGLVNDNNTLCRPPRLSEACQSDRHCGYWIKGHATCKDNICVCGDGYVAVNNTECRLPRLFEECAGTSQCSESTPYSVCKGSMCVCMEGLWAERNATCRQPPRLNDPCDTTSRCQATTAHSVCQQGVCRCADGYSSPSHDEDCRPVDA